MNILVDTLVADVLGNFSLSFFVQEDNRVKMGLGSIVLYPPLTWVVRILEVTGKRGG